MSGPLCTYDEACKAAAEVLTRAFTRMAWMTAEEIADEALRPGGPSREELIAKVNQLRAEYQAQHPKAA
jgi:propanediol dehydratase small subunit